VTSITDSPSPEFSVIITCFNEELTISTFYNQLSAVFRQCRRPYEIIMVNDGSQDRTFDQLVKLFHQHDDITCVIDLYSNSGQASAITAGLQEARGHATVLMDSDLQVDPQDWPLLLEQYDRGFDVVLGRRVARKDKIWRRAASILANFIVRKVVGHPVSDIGCTFKVYRSSLLKSFGFDQYRTLDQLPVIKAAGSVAEVPIHHRARAYGQSGWNLKKLLDYNLDNILHFINSRFQYLFYINIGIAFLVMLRIFIAFFFSGSLLPVVTTGLLLNVLLLGIFILVAILTFNAELSRRALSVVLKRPMYVIKSKLKK